MAWILGLPSHLKSLTKYQSKSALCQVNEFFLKIKSCIILTLSCYFRRKCCIGLKPSNQQLFCFMTSSKFQSFGFGPYWKQNKTKQTPKEKIASSFGMIYFYTAHCALNYSSFQTGLLFPFLNQYLSAASFTETFLCGIPELKCCDLCCISSVGHLLSSR